eukprot:m.227966 g.227966  ORF g.227966 m.227966 type:complete len:653 (-) comp15186_c3_seq3:1400-3358(-)
MSVGCRTWHATLRHGVAVWQQRMTAASQLLSDFTVHTKYARYLPEQQRRETWDELVARNAAMHRERFPHLAADIDAAYNFVHKKLVLPSMRSLQFAGPAVAKNNSRMFNCSYIPLSDVTAFRELVFLLLSGTGVGFSVQQHHVAQLPRLRHPDPLAPTRTHVVADSIEGWADAAHALISTYLATTPNNMQRREKQQTPKVVFDYSRVRPAGSPLVTAGGRAPGPEPLRASLEAVRAVLDATPDNTRITSLQAHDIACHLATCVASGGIRRSALISLFSQGDEDMFSAKSGDWWMQASQRAMANNSVVLPRASTTEDQFKTLWAEISANRSGEPGIYFTNDVEWGTNPCCEIALEPHQFCNLTEINASVVTSQQSLNKLASVAAFIGTLQASYTDFHYISPQWQKTTERGALLGVSMTGIATGNLRTLDLGQAAKAAKLMNTCTAASLGINPAHRVTTVKPAGTTSLVLGTSSGIHPWHAEHYIRRVRVNKHEAVYAYLLKQCPHMLEDDVMNPAHVAVLSFPQHAPPTAALRTEPASMLLERIRSFHEHWISPGHSQGANTNNVSATVSLSEGEWDEAGQWMWSNRHAYNGLCVLPRDDHSYTQAPFEAIDAVTYQSLSQTAWDFDLSKVREDQDHTELQLAPACAGGACTI